MGEPRMARTGQPCQLNGDGDLGMEPTCRKVITTGEVGVVGRRTKGGKIVCVFPSGIVSVRPRNVILLPDSRHADPLTGAKVAFADAYVAWTKKAYPARRDNVEEERLAKIVADKRKRLLALLPPAAAWTSEKWYRQMSDLEAIAQARQALADAALAWVEGPWNMGQPGQLLHQNLFDAAAKVSALLAPAPPESTG